MTGGCAFLLICRDDCLRITVAQTDKEPPLYFSKRVCTMFVYVSVTQSQHPLHVVRSTIIINMLSCCAKVAAYITQKPSVCYASMSLPVQQFVLHIPRHHHIVRGMMLIGLKVWKSPLFSHRDSLSKTHTFIYTCAWKNQHQQKHQTHWNCGFSEKEVIKCLTVCHHSYNTIQYHCLTVILSLCWPFYTLFFIHLTVNRMCCQCPPRLYPN